MVNRRYMVRASGVSFWIFCIKVIKPYWSLVCGQITVALVWAVDFALRPYLIKVIVDLHTLTSRPANVLLTPILLYFGLMLFVFLIFRFYEWIILVFRPNLIKHIGEMLMTTLMNKSHRFFQNQFSGSLANKVGDVSKGISDIIDIFIDSFLANIIALLLSTYAFYNISIELAVALVLWIILFISCSLQLSKHGADLAKNTAQRRSDIVGLIVDILTNIFSVRVFRAQTHEAQTLTKAYKKFVQSYRVREWFFMKIHSTQEISFILYQILCFVWLLHYEITPGDLAMVMILNTSIVNVLHSLARNISSFSESFGNVMQGLQTIYGDMNENNVEKLKILGPISSKEAEISFQSLSFSYPLSDGIFNDISITIPACQKVGLVGYSGSGKTTFVNLILGLFKATSGQILVARHDIDEISKESLYQNIGIIPQDITLFNRSLMENIRYGKIDATDEEVIEAAKKAKAHEFIEKLPEGYNSLVGERGVKLSGGQRQRIAIARAMLKSAPILLMDEATNQLDSITEHQIQEGLNTLMKGKTTIIIAHRLSTLLHLDRILVFDKGKIVQDDTHHDLIKQDGLYQILWQHQSNGFLPVSKDDV